MAKRLKVFRIYFSYGKNGFSYDVRSTNEEQAIEITKEMIERNFDHPERVRIGKPTEIKNYCGNAVGFIIPIM